MNTLDQAIVLREVQESDLPIFFEQQLEPEALLMSGFPGRSRRAFMDHWARAMVNPTVVFRTILFQGSIAGNIVLWGEEGERMVGYWLGKDFWSRGIATAALLRFLVEVETRPVLAWVAKHNAASLRVLEKCGFAKCGEDWFPGDTGHQEWVMRLS